MIRDTIEASVLSEDKGEKGAKILSHSFHSVLVKKNVATNIHVF